MTRVRVRPRAQLDIDEACAYYALEASADVAQRFLQSVDRAFQRLCERPFIGARMEVLEPALTGLRYWAVPGFERHLVLYFASEESVEVARVVHTARERAEVLAAVNEVH